MTSNQCSQSSPLLASQLPSSLTHILPRALDFFIPPRPTLFTPMIASSTAEQAAALRALSTAASNRRPRGTLALPTPPPTLCGGGRGRGVGPAARTRGRKRGTAVEEDKNMAEGNNDVYEEQEADIQQLMKELARNQEAEVALRAQIAAQEQRQQQGPQKRQNIEAQNYETLLRIAELQVHQQTQASALGSPGPPPNATLDNVNFDFVHVQLRERSGGKYELQMETLPMRGNQGNDPPFLTVLRYRYASIPVSALKDIISNTLPPVNIMKLSTDYSKGKSNKRKEADCESSGVK